MRQCAFVNASANALRAFADVSMDMENEDVSTNAHRRIRKHVCVHS